MTAYYNEIDPYAAQWLRNLISSGHIAPGEVDERSIIDVSPGDLVGFTQCHFFAGIGVWSYALRQAGWADTRRVWTGSCPCQPFSAAGKGLGTTDARHLWPVWSALIRQCRPAVVFGEQVENAIRHGWLDIVCDDLENMGYAVGALGIPAAGVGAPHIRQRVWFVAHADGKQPRKQPEAVPAGQCELGGNGCADWVADAERQRVCVLGQGCSGGQACAMQGDCAERQRIRADAGANVGAARAAAGPTNGHWRNADWLLCRDGRWRPVESGTFPLAHGATARLGRLRAYGNAIVPQVASAFIGAYLAVIGIEESESA